MSSTVELRRQIKLAVNRVPAERLDSLADYVSFLTRPPLHERVKTARQEIAAGKRINWRKVRRDV